jgi:hypothetical protein
MHRQILCKTGVSIDVRVDPSQYLSCRLIKLIESLKTSLAVEDTKYGSGSIATAFDRSESKHPTSL